MAGWRAPLAQTASNGAAIVTAQMIRSGSLDGEVSDILQVFDTIADHIFTRLDEVKARDDEAYDANIEQPKAKGTSKGSTGKRAGKGGSTARKSTGKVTLENSLSMELNFGAFEGKTLADLLEIDADEADSDYGYGDGERDGRDYIAWLASPRTKSRAIRDRARLVADENGIEYDEE
jgi:hypothetical protein